MDTRKHIIRRIYFTNRVCVRVCIINISACVRYRLHVYETTGIKASCLRTAVGEAEKIKHAIHRT